jgi:hypothetical protein
VIAQRKCLSQEANRIALQWFKPICKAGSFSQPRIGDQVTVDRIKELVAEMNAQKAKFHPEKE